MTQDQQPPVQLTGLLAQRSAVQVDIGNLERQRARLQAQIEAGGSSRQRLGELRTELADVDARLRSAINVVRVIDANVARLGGQPVQAVPVASEPARSGTLQPPVSGDLADLARAAAPAVGASVLSCALVGAALLMYFRRSVNRLLGRITPALGELDAKVAALSSGIDAVEVELERIGEAQRYVAKSVDARGDRVDRG